RRRGRRRPTVQRVPGRTTGALAASAAAAVAASLSRSRPAPAPAGPPPPYEPPPAYSASAPGAPPPYTPGSSGGSSSAGEEPPAYSAVAQGGMDPRELTDFQLDELVHRIIGRVTRLVRTELRMDRERIGRLRDPRG
ncbi:extensin, partial [Streptomyces albidoflavus]|uniref:extensin n=1 Tax=Streptomyces albidoflavus TaxID=1886 RepID=UPI0033D5A9E0